MSNTAPSRADPVVVFPLGRWCPPQETSQPHPPPNGWREQGYISMDLISGFPPSQIARFMGPTWGPPGADRTQVGPMLAPWTLLSGFTKLWCWLDWGLPEWYSIEIFIRIQILLFTKMFLRSSSFTKSRWHLRSFTEIVLVRKAPCTVLWLVAIMTAASQP